MPPAAYPYRPKVEDSARFFMPRARRGRVQSTAKRDKNILKPRSIKMKRKDLGKFRGRCNECKCELKAAYLKRTELAEACDRVLQERSACFCLRSAGISAEDGCILRKRHSSRSRLYLLHRAVVIVRAPQKAFRHTHRPHLSATKLRVHIGNMCLARTVDQSAFVWLRMRTG